MSIIDQISILPSRELQYYKEVHEFLQNVYKSHEKRDLNIDAELGESLLSKIANFEIETAFSSLNEQDEHGEFLSIKIAECIGRRRYQEFVTRVAFSKSNLVPYDLRCKCFEILQLEHWIVGEPEGSQASSVSSMEIGRVSITDGIDHLFEFPTDLNEVLELLQEVSQIATARTIGDLRQRSTAKFQRLKKLDCEFTELENSSEILAKYEEYIVDWDQQFRTSYGVHTLGEILRILFMDKRLHVPHLRIRSTVVGFYRSVLKISSGAVIGLGGGLLSVEHGPINKKSIFYLGPNAILGKGAVVDVTGSFILERNGFVGGGYSPILIHTHKHLGVADGGNERSKIGRAIFYGAKGSRLPMTFVGLFEAYDYIGSVSPFSGITCLDHLD